MRPPDPFTLSLSKRRTTLGPAQPSRALQVERCQINKPQPCHMAMRMTRQQARYRPHTA